MNRRYTYDDAFNQNMLADTDVCQNGGISARGHGMDSFSSNTASKAKSATKPKPSNEYEHERLVPLSTSTNGDTDDSSFRRFRRLRIVAGAFCALSVALLVALIAVSIVLSNRSTSGMPTPAAPNFTITPEAFGQYTRVLIRNEATGEYVALLPEVGGTVHQLTLRSARDATQLSTLLNNEPIPEFIPSSRMFRGARLIPWPNRIPDGTYIFDGTSYRVPINDVSHNMSIHGLLYKRNMTVVSQSISPTQASVELSFDFGSAATRDSGYPFPVIIKIVYALTAQGEFIATTTATLNGPPDSSAPFGDGWHPYFVLAAGSTNALFAQVPATTEVQLDKAQLPLPGVPTQPFTRIPADGSLMRLYDLDVCLVVDAARTVTRRIGASDVRVAETVLSHPDTRLEVVVFQEAASYPYVQLFTQWNEVAIEPVTAPANAFNTGVGLIKLEPGVPWSGRMGVYIA